MLDSEIKKKLMGTEETAAHRQLQTLPSERVLIWKEGETELKKMVSTWTSQVAVGPRNESLF